MVLQRSHCRIEDSDSVQGQGRVRPARVQRLQERAGKDQAILRESNHLDRLRRPSREAQQETLRIPDSKAADPPDVRLDLQLRAHGQHAQEQGQLLPAAKPVQPQESIRHLQRTRRALPRRRVPDSLQAFLQVRDLPRAKGQIVRRVQPSAKDLRV